MGLCNKSLDDPFNKKIFCLGACFLIFLEKIKKQAPKHHCVSPPEAAKYFLRRAHHGTDQLGFAGLPRPAASSRALPRRPNRSRAHPLRNARY
jgi:hypothetical protein